MKQKLLYICLMILSALAWSGEVWGDERTVQDYNDTYTYSISSSSSLNPCTFTNSTGANVVFKFSGASFSYDSTLKALNVPKNETFTLSWEVPSSEYVINVTEVSVSTGASLKAYVSVDDSKSGNLAWNTQTVTKSGLNLGNTGKINIKTESSRSGVNIYIYSFSIKYTLTHKEFKYYGKSTTTAFPLAGGTVYTSFSSYENASSESATITSDWVKTSSATASVYNKATANSGYEFLGWTLASEDYTEGYKSENENYSCSVTYESKNSNSPTTYSYKAWFAPVFNFSVVANTINGSYGTATASVENKVLSEPSESSVNTIATFEAKPNEGCTFEGWYKDEAHTQPASADNSYKNKKYQPTLANSVIGSTVGLTLYAYFKSNQTISWNNESAINTNLKVEDTSSVTATANSGLSVSYSSDNTGVLTINSTTGAITAVGAGTATITVSQDGNAVYNSASISKTFTVTKYDQTLNWTTEDFTILPTEVLDVAESSRGLPVTYSTSSGGSVISVTADGKVKGMTEGTDTITVSQAGNYKYNAATSISHIFTVSKKQATFTPAWGESLTTDIKVGTSTTIGLTNIATDATFTITNGDATILGVTREGNTLTITGLKAGTTTLQLNQTGSTTLSGANTTYTIIVSRYTNNLAVAVDELQNMLVGDTLKSVVSANTGNGNPIQATYTKAGVATYDAANNRIIALTADSTTVILTQAATTTHAAATKRIHISVTKVPNTLSVTLASSLIETEVGNPITATIAGRNNTGTDIVAEIHTDSISPINDSRYGVISYEDGVITARNAGKARITFSQAATTKYTDYTSDTYEISVSKRANSITITNLGGGTATNIRLKYGATAALAYTATNTDTSPVVSRASGSYTSYSNGTITAGSSAGTDIYEITQTETYKYKAGYTSFTVRVNNTDEVDGYVLHHEGESYTGNWSEGAALTMSGPGDLLSFQATKNMDTAIGDMIVKISTNGNDWSTRESIGVGSLNKNDYKPFSYSLDDEAIRYIRFDNDGSYRKYYKEVKVRRKTYVRASANRTDLGTRYTDQTASATFTVNYSSTNGGNINIQSNNAHFVPSISSISVETNKTATDNSVSPSKTYICGVEGTQTFTVTYHPDPDNLGAESAVITIADLFYTQQITLTATSQKYTTSITRGTNTATATTVDGSISNNVFAFSGTSTATPSASSEADFYYSISSSLDEGVHIGANVISYNPATNTITGLEAGTARLTITQKKTTLYHATSQSFDFTVTRLPNNVGIALSPTTLNVDGTATVTLNNPVSDGGLSASWTTPQYANESQNRSGGLLSFTDGTLTAINAGTATVTITQAETYKYVSKSATFDVTVNKLTQTLTWDNPVETGMQVNTTLSGNTATSDVGLTPVTYESGNTAIITVNETTGVLTAVAVGSNIMIKASQAGNYKYLPASISRTFSVFNKSVPVFTPDESFSGTSGQIEYTGTATITVTGVSDGDDFSITGYDGNVISVVRDNETITITGLALGNTMLTLAQQGNDDFIAKTQTYNIEVYWPDDFLALSSSTSPSYTEDTYRKVFFNNTLKSGYSTIALPFNTTVEDIVGTGYDEDDDWVAQLAVVTNNSKDGYSLYFEKKSDIVANQPYILHLGTAVNSPVFTNVSVVAAATAAQYTTKGVSDANQWVLHSNYNPTFDMEGYYGVVGEKIKKGAEGSSLKAYHAYIEGPTAAAVKAAYLDEDEADGLLEVLKGEGLITERVYDLQGRQLPRTQRGINIVRGADGVVRKALVK